MLMLIHLDSCNMINNTGGQRLSGMSFIWIVQKCQNWLATTGGTEPCWLVNASFDKSSSDTSCKGSYDHFLQYNIIFRHATICWISKLWLGIESSCSFHTSWVHCLVSPNGSSSTHGQCTQRYSQWEMDVVQHVWNPSPSLTWSV